MPGVNPMALPLSGRSALITGVSRRRGIGYAVASRLAADGASVFVHHHRAHDAAQPWGADDLDEVLTGLRAGLTDGATLADIDLDLADPDAPDELVAAARASLGHLDVLVCNHAQSGHDGPLEEITAETLDRHWQVNTRSTVLLTRAFAAQHDGRETGRVVWLTSGQGQGPTSGTIAYAASKAALAGLTASVADPLADRGILLNTVNPGPVNTGYLDDVLAGPDAAAVLARFPAGRAGDPDDPARLVAWLVSDEGRWMVGQVLHTEGGFRRWG